MLNAIQLADDLYVRVRLNNVELALLLLVRLQNHKRDFTTVTISKIARHLSKTIDDQTLRNAWEAYKKIRGEGDNGIMFENLRRDIHHLRQDPVVNGIISDEEQSLQNLMRTETVIPLSTKDQEVFEETFRGTYFKLDH